MSDAGDISPPIFWIFCQILDDINTAQPRHKCVNHENRQELILSWWNNASLHKICHNCNYKQLVNFPVNFQNLRTFVVIFVLSRFTHISVKLGKIQVRPKKKRSSPKFGEKVRKKYWKLGKILWKIGKNTEN